MYFVNYHKTHFYLVGEEVAHDWLKCDELLQGFVWKYGTNGETKGITMYHKPFVIKDSLGGKVCFHF